MYLYQLYEFAVVKNKIEVKPIQLTMIKGVFNTEFFIKCFLIFG